jgi:AcrR family transcriptional regulator
VDTPIQLPTIAPENATPRADALRNRARILAAARRLFADHGAACVSMDDIADAAGVGKGTLFRRFGSRSALALALLDEQETAFQDGFIRGEPPLGPGASPADRLIAFGEGRLDLLEAHSDLIATAEVGASRLTSPPYAVYRLHMTLLVREADPTCDPAYLVESLLSCLGAEEFLHMREQLGLSLEQVKAGWRELVTRVFSDTLASGASENPPAERVELLSAADQ